MTLNEYQKQAMTTCTKSSANFSYMALNLVGEVGEFMSKVAKAIRKEEATIEDPYGIALLIKPLGISYDKEKYEDALKLEAGDMLWQLSGLCNIMGWDLEDVAQMNLDKLAARKAAGTIVGNGDGILNR